MIRNADCVVIVTDDRGLGELLVEVLLQETSSRPLLFSDSSLALRAIRLLRPVLLILDEYLPGTDGITFSDQLRTLQELQPIPTLLIGATLDGREHEIKERGLIAFGKPLDLETFLLRMKDVLCSPGKYSSDQ